MTDNELAIAERLNEIERWWNGASLNADEAHRSTTAIQPTEIVNLCRELLAALAQEHPSGVRILSVSPATLGGRLFSQLYLFLNAVRDSHERFTTCDACHRVFWEGSHWRRMRAVLDEAAQTAAQTADQ